MGGGHGGCALLTRPTVMRLMSGFAWRVRFAYPPYGDEANVRFCMAGALALTRPTVMRLILTCVGWVSAAHPPEPTHPSLLLRETER